MLERIVATILIVMCVASNSSCMNTTDACGDTPLHRTMHNPGTKLARRIKKASTEDLNAQNHSGSTPLMSAVIWNKPHAVALLLKRGNGQINTTDKYGRTPLHYAAGLGLTDIAKMLLENGATEGAKDSDQQTPLDMARLRHDERHRCVRLLNPASNTGKHDGDTHSCEDDDANWFDLNFIRCKFWTK